MTERGPERPVLQVAASAPSRAGLPFCFPPWTSLVFAAPYALLVIWFHGVDVYHAHFSTSGLIVVVYNCFRVLFIFYLFWMVEAVGALLLRGIARNEFDQLAGLERLALAFFAGAGVWHVAMLALGYLDLYTVPVALALTLPIVVWSYGDARAAAAKLRRGAAKDDALPGALASGLLGRIVLGIGALAFGALLLVKGLYPGGGHDYFTHYFYYLQAAIEHHGLWPNDVWYHYYYSKGAGLYFLGILVTDPLAPQLVTFTFMAAAGAALLLLLRRIAPGTLWPPVGAALFFGLYIYTPGAAVLYQTNGGWGDFEKLHEINAAVVIAVLWMTVEALCAADRRRLLWFSSAASAIVCAIIVNITVAIFFGGVFAVLAGCYAVARRLDKAALCLALGMVAGMSLLAMLTINQMTTGLANDQGILLFWNFANPDKLARWGALPLVILLYQGSRAMAAASEPLSYHTAIFLIESFRLDLVIPLLIGGAIVAVPGLLRRRWNPGITTPALVMIAAALTFTAIALVFGRAQQVSFYRYSSFATALAIVCGVLAWSVPGAEGRAARLARYRPAAVLVLLLCLATDADPRLTPKALERGIHFATGRYSIDLAYQNQYGPPPRQAWTAVNPGARGAYETVGPKTRIWSFHIHTYCMLPDCRVETFPAFIMTKDWPALMFGTPQQGERALQAAHLNYFLYTRDDAIRDILPASPLFAPDNIAQYLGIRWTDGTSYLLTWLEPGIRPLDAAWIADYRHAVEQSGTVASFPYDTMKQIFARLNATPHPWRAFQLPW